MPKLTDKIARTEAPPTDKPYRIIWDADHRDAVPGFGLRITKAGKRAFILNYRFQGRERRMTIGAFSDWSVAAAREQAKSERRKIDEGRDPLAERNEQRHANTMRDLWTRFEADYLPKRRPGTQKAYAGLWNAYGGKLASRKVADPDLGAAIEQQHAKIARNTPYRANRWLALLSKMFNLAIRWRIRGDNPVKGIERAPEYRRERYLSGDELRRLLEALNETEQRGKRQAQSANAIRLLILTGARRMEVLSATWDQFDLDAGVWSKPPASTKQKEPHRVPLNGPAIQLLASMDRTSEYVFPSPDGKGHQKDIKNTWASVTKLAGIDARLHDLRHTYAAHLASAGQSLPIIGALLGHTQAQTTKRYAHLLDDPLREATERVGNVISGSEKADVQELRKCR